MRSIAKVCSIMILVSVGAQAAIRTNDFSLANNAFAVDIYRQLSRSPGNIVASPLSIRTALAVSLLGAHGKTAEQMNKALHWESDGTNAYADYGASLSKLSARDPGCEVLFGNAVFIQSGFSIQPDFRRVTQDSLGAELEEIDFTGWPNEFDPAKAAAARTRMNSWVANHTHGKISALVPQSMPDAETRLMIVNATWFKGRWESPFPKEFTTNSPFYVKPGEGTSVPTMRMTGDFRYAETEAFQMIELPYVSNHFSMFVLLPRDPGKLDKVEADLSPPSFDQYQRMSEVEEVGIALPKFKEVSEFDLIRSLQAMGITDAFSKTADFSGITAQKPFFIEAVLHNACVEVNEEGTEATAATAVGMGQGLPKRFIADHPFLFWIRDNQTGAILFIGKVADPSKASL